MQDMERDTDEILIERQGSAAILRLNRPKALNSVTLDMVRVMKRAMADFIDDPDVACVILAGAGERGLCAGGDIRKIYDQGKAGDAAVTQFWREEFPLNYTISHYPKPYVALMDGITMGGGVGLASHGAVRIVTERTRLAMPETGIGYFPDVGTTWLLPRAPGEAGTFMALTGNEISPADAIFAGLADHAVASADLDRLVAALGELAADADLDAVKAVVGRFSISLPEGPLSQNRAAIDRIFHFDTVEEILSALEREPGDFAAEIRATMLKRSPTSLKLALKLLRLGRKSSGLVECLEREFAAGSQVLRGHDFYEGVRAAIIDKDRNPQWQPADLGAVSDHDIARYLVIGHHPLFPDHRL